MAKHTAPVPRGKRIRNLIIVLLTFCAAAAICVGLLAATSARQGGSAGDVISGELVFAEQQWLIPRTSGGYLLLSSDGSTETKAVYLTETGKVEEGEDNGFSLFGVPERLVVRDETLYLVISFADESGAVQGILMEFPLNSGSFDGITQYLLDSSILLQTINLDRETNRFYGISGDTWSVVRFQLDGGTPEKTVVAATGGTANPISLERLAIDGETVYAVGFDIDGQRTLWQGRFSGDQIEFGYSQTIGEELQFPLTFLENGLAVDALGDLYDTTANGLAPIVNAPTFVGNVCLDGSGNLVGITSQNRIDLFSPADLTAVSSFYQYQETVCAIASRDNVAVLLRDGDDYRCVLLNESDASSGTSSAPVSSEPSESSDAEDTVTSAESSELDDNVSSEDPLHPIQSGLESSGLSSEDVSSDTSSEEEMLPWIVSTTYDVKRPSNTVVVPYGTTLARFRKTVPLQGATLSAVKADGTQLYSGKLGTGTLLQLYHDWELMDEITVIVMGDLNGNGVVNTADIKLLFQHLADEIQLTGCFYSAANMDGDEVVDTRDLVLLKRQYE